MIKSILTAMVKQIAAGLPMASREEIKKRAEICLSCDQMEDERCKQCGCFLKFKIPLGTSECPMKKW